MPFRSKHPNKKFVNCEIEKNILIEIFGTKKSNFFAARLRANGFTSARGSEVGTLASRKKRLQRPPRKAAPMQGRFAGKL
jgi:hypothetical protein